MPIAEDNFKINTLMTTYAFQAGDHPSEAYGTEGEAQEALAFLEAEESSNGKLQTDLRASELNDSNKNGSATYDLPEDTFYAFIAPYYDYPPL